MRTLVVALGGNAILQRGETGTAEEQLRNVRCTCRQVVNAIKAGYRVVLTHGNGPQVGNIIIQNELGREMVPAMPMDICGAESQGLIGYMMAQEMENALLAEGMNIPVVSVITRTLVSKDDPAFKNPSKPVGPFKDAAWAKKRQEEYGESWIEDSGRGWRRVVPSPDPLEIVEGRSIRNLVDAGHLVICNGGGGIPVVREDSGVLRGVEAVIDKDLGAERLACAVGADTLMILTDVNGAAVNYKGSNERWLEEVTVEELAEYEKEGHFKKGSMGPKVKAIIRFVQHGGELGIIASLEQMNQALSGNSGTRVRRV